MRKAYVLVFDGYADWELGYILPELRRFGKIEVMSVSFSDKPVVSMGGLRIIPDKTLSHIEISDMLIFILPGGYLWEGSYPRVEIEQFLHQVEKAQIPIAAICAATTVVARAGLVSNRKHTSNSLPYVSKMVPEYSLSDYYVESLAMRDNHIITASGLGAIEFAVEIMNELDIATPHIREQWYEAFKRGKYPEDITTND